MEIWQAIVLAIVEGITEFLPVSSTGHMIIVSSFMGIASDSFVKLFTIAIQFGAILSVIVLYWKRFFQSFEFYFKIFLAFIPAAIIGFLLNDFIDALLERVDVVAYMLIAGGIFFLWVDKIFKQNETQPKDSTYLSSFKIGLFQLLALIPGVSRSAATIIGGLTQGLNKKNAAEFSFFLAVPTMFAATSYKLFSYWKNGGTFGDNEISILLMGNIVAFIVAMLAIKSFIAYLTKHGFKMFGYYRIILGVILLIFLTLGYDLKIV
ncbi:MAG: undecaprenyl-diphosphate phosphatase [Cyclobacteriaceae bacterium]|jgi:undecaprenyl-diphosphatase|nr:undecaprenyl-diphosphate phosphatase [Cyclobacteriaceae bacterium]